MCLSAAMLLGNLLVLNNDLFSSDFSMLASTIPYFQLDGEFKALSTEGVHLVICVHGLDGKNSFKNILLGGSKTPYILVNKSQFFT